MLFQAKTKNQEGIGIYIYIGNFIIIPTGFHHFSEGLAATTNQITMGNHHFS